MCLKHSTQQIFLTIIYLIVTQIRIFNKRVSFNLPKIELLRIYLHLCLTFVPALLDAQFGLCSCINRCVWVPGLHALAHRLPTLTWTCT